MSGRNVNKLFAAKTGNSSSLWLPLWMHHRDTCAVMRYLLEEFVSPSIAISCAMTENDLKKAAVVLSMTHDIGKATVGFQYKIGLKLPERTGALRQYIDIPDVMDMEKLRSSPHSVMGEAILRYLGCPEEIAVIVGAHHGFFADGKAPPDLGGKRKDIIGYRNYFGDTDDTRAQLEELWRDIVKDALDAAGLNGPDELPHISQQGQMILSGLLITADWIASNTEFFPLISIDDTGLDTDCEKRTDNALEELDLTEKWRSERTDYDDETFKETFGFYPGSIQKSIIDTVEKCRSPGVFILEAPMGCGKTEAALSSAELLAAKCRKKGLFIGMPTQATANGIFPRIVNWAEKQSEEFYHSIALKHGSAELNKTFKKIQRGIPEVDTDSGLIVHSWFCDSKKACLADFVAATVDQMLMMALRRKHVMLLHLGLSEKVVIIDEVHAYDAYMNQYLERALQWLGIYHTPVILLSATLPAKRRMSLIRAYMGQKTSDESFETTTAYPLLTWTDGESIQQAALPVSGEQKTVSIVKGVPDLSELIRSAVEKGGCVGIMMNTVKRAQETAEMIRGSITENVLLCHAQYIFPDRAAKEEELIRRIGKDSGPPTRKGFAVVGTQVLEQSLDIDFDLLITDICPMDLLLQRVGRLHRHTRERPAGFEIPCCYVLTEELEKENSGTRKIYGSWLLNETLKELPESITLPDDISPLVQRVYGAYDESDEYREYTVKNRILENKAKAFLLKKPNGKSIRRMADGIVNESHAEASVRDGVSSAEVLVMKLFSSGDIGFIDGTRLSADMTEEECERIAGQKLRLPAIFSQKWNIYDTISELESKCRPYISQWQSKPMLAGHLVLFLDENNEAELGGQQLKYDFEKGLTYRKGSDDGE